MSETRAVDQTAQPLPLGMVLGLSLLAIPLLVAGPGIAVFVGYTNLPRPRALALLSIGLLVGTLQLLLAIYAFPLAHYLQTIGWIPQPPGAPVH